MKFGCQRASDLIDELKNDQMKPIIVLMLSNYSYISSVIRQINNENQLSNYISWLIMKPKDLGMLEMSTISPAVRLFTFSFYEASNSKHIHLDYMHTNFVEGHLDVSHFGHWSAKSGLVTNISYRRCCYNLKGYLIRIVYCQDDEPNVSVIRDGNSWNISGIVGDVTTVVLEHLNLTIIDVYPQADNNYGDVLMDNTSSGMFADLMTDKADLAIGGIAPTRLRKHAVDFTIGLLSAYITGMYKSEEFEYIWSFYYKPFSEPSWILILTGSLTFLLVTSVTMKILFRASFNETILRHWGAMLNQGTYEHQLAVSNAIKTFYLWILVLGILLTTFYNSKIVANKAVELTGQRFQSLLDIAEDREYHPLVWKDSILTHVFKNSTDYDYSELYKRINADIRYNTASSMKEIINGINNTRAVYLNQIWYLLLIKRLHNEFLIMDNHFLDHWISVAFRKNSPLTSIFNNIVLDLQEGGVIDKIVRRYKERNKITGAPRPQPISFMQMRLPLLFLTVGIVISLSILLVETKVMQLFKRYD